MKKIILAALIVFSCLLSSAQDSLGFIISLNAGVASPTGNFSKGDYADEKSGFAKTGGHFNITGVYHLNKNFGIGALVGYSQFGFKGSKSLADGYKEDSGTDSTTLYRKGHTEILSVLAGPFYSIPLGDKFSFHIRALAGYAHTNLAGFQVFYEDYLDNAMTQKKASGGAFAYQAGLGLSYNVTKNMTIKLNTDYFSTKSNFNIKYENFVVNSGRRLTKYNENLSSVNATAGIAFKL